eukprot:COSAG02_NODE_71471_length_191_cov_17.456522_1_plen_63_part_11
MRFDQLFLFLQLRRVAYLEIIRHRRCDSPIWAEKARIAAEALAAKEAEEARLAEEKALKEAED